MNLPRHFRQLCFLLCLVFCGSSHATADGPDFYRLNGVATDSERVMRAEPRTEAAPLLGLPAAARCLRSLGCQGGLSQAEYSARSDAAQPQPQVASPRWCKVSYQGTTGWVEARFLAEACCAEPVSQDARIERIRLAGETGRQVIKARLHGRQFVDYQVSGGAGQTLTVSLVASNGQNYFNILPPGTAVAMFVGSQSGGQFSGMLPADGIYTVRVYLMRAAARRQESSRYALKVDLAGKLLAARPAHTDALIPGTPYHASAPLACAYEQSTLSQRCESFVIRRGFDGAATLEIRWPVGALRQIRRILFVKGVPVASDSPYPMIHTRQGDMTTIHLGDQESVAVPDALIVGG